MAEEPSYARIDGRWLTDGRSCGVIHRMAVARGLHGRGLGGRFMRQAELVLAERGAVSVRIDTHEGNLPMQALLARMGYTRCGTIRLLGGSEAGAPRLAYEKIIKTDK